MSSFIINSYVHSSPLPGDHRYWRIFVEDTNFATNDLVSITEIEFITTLTGFGEAEVLTGANAAADEDDGAGTEAEQAIDGDFRESANAIWSTTTATPGLPHWWSYDFGVGTDVQVIGINMHGRYVNQASMDAQPKDFIVEFSDDNNNWFEAWSETGQTWVAHEFKKFLHPNAASYTGSPHGSHEHWRMLFQQDDGGTINSASEVEWRATPSGADQATGGAPISGGDVGFPDDNAYDGNNATFFASTTTLLTTSWLGYSFASPVAVAEISWRNRQDADANQAPKTCLVQHAESAIGPWTTAWQVTGETGWSLGETRVFTDPYYI